MKKMSLALIVALFSTCAFAQDAYLQVTLTNDAVTKISLSDIKDFRFVTVEAADPEPDPEPDPETPAEAVDLGLSVKWASCNLGASKPEEYGDYYGWGRTRPYAEGEDVGWPLYFQELGGTGISASDCGTDKDLLRDYVYPNYLSIAGTEYDAAHVKLGGTWRMPTTDEIREFLINTTSVWIKQNDVCGRKFTSKINGNSIFMPAAGRREGEILKWEGTICECWSANPSSLCWVFGAECMRFSSDDYTWDWSDRCFGAVIRPVTE